MLFNRHLLSYFLYEYKSYKYEIKRQQKEQIVNNEYKWLVF